MLRPIDLKFFLSLLREHLEISHRRLGMDSARRARLALLIVALTHREVEIVCRSNELMRPNRGGLLNNLAGSGEHQVGIPIPLSVSERVNATLKLLWE